MDKLSSDENEVSAITSSELISDIITDIFNNINDMNTNSVLNESVATLDDSIHTDALGDPHPHQDQATSISSTKSLNL